MWGSDSSLLLTQSAPFQLLSALFDAAPIGLALLDTELRVIRVNRTLSAIRGSPPEADEGRLAREVLGEDWAMVGPLLQRVLDTGEPNLDMELTRPARGAAETPRHFLGNHHPVRSAAGELLGVAIAVLDITARKEAEAVLEARRVAERALYDQLSALHTVSLELAAAATFDDLCRQAVELGRERLGFERLALWFRTEDGARMRGSFGTDEAGQTRDERHESFPLNPADPLALIFSGRDRSLRLEEMTLRGEGRDVGHGTVLLGALWNGTEVIGYLAADTLFTGAPFSAEREELLTQYAATIGHLGARLRVEEALREAQATLEERIQERTARLHEREVQMIQTEKLRALGEISAGIAHDLNNRLTAVLGYTRLARGEVTLARMRERLDIIEEASIDAAATVLRIQNFARQRQSAEGAPVTLAAVAAAARTLCRPHWNDIAQTRGIAIRVDDDLAPAFVLGQEAELRDAVFNLILNAVQAMPEGGTIALRTGTEEGSAWLTVTDTGVGMPESVRARCFDPFFTTRPPEGTGLGLATVYATIRRHAGEPILLSEPGRGTTIGFRLPALEKPAAAVTVGARRSWTGGGRHLLLVEDEPLVQCALQELLARPGHLVHAVADAEEALQVLETTLVDAVITDQGIPGMPGTELAARIEERWPALPVLLLTGWGQAAADQVRSGNVRAVLRKPATDEELFLAIDALFA